jgi:hypothetical protein
MVLEKENVNEVQRRWRNEFGTEPATCITFAWLCDKSGADGAMQNTDKKHSEDLAVQLTTKVLRRYYRSSHSRQEVCMAALS